jgi:hypothetical protein
MIQWGKRYCAIFTDFRMPKKLVRIIKIHLNEAYSKDCTGKNLYDEFPTENGLEQRNALSPLLFIFAL